MKTIMLKSSESKYENEYNYSWDNYFGFSLRPLLEGKTALDLGCFTGGRTVAWFERYKLNYISGIDVSEIYIKAARQFASIKNAKADFRVGFGESLPFKNGKFDSILSFDVFEHVNDLHKTLNECHRVLKLGGRLFTVFPSYFHPIEHHLSLVTLTPCIHWFFRSETLMKAYCKIIEERGEEAHWYKRSSPKLEKWERLNTINGTVLSQFKRLIRVGNWKVIKEIHKPIGSIGRNVSTLLPARILSWFFKPLTYMPGLQEIFLHRITFILEK